MINVEEGTPLKEDAHHKEDMIEKKIVEMITEEG
jgi:hypothetical protein